MDESFLSRLLRGPNQRETIECAEATFEVTSKASYTRVEWTALRAIEAFKLDRLTTDLIYLALSVDGVADPVLIHEEKVGFQRFSSEIGQRYKGLDREWYAKVMLPPFGDSTTAVWTRTESQE